MHTLKDHTETEDGAVLQSGTSRTTKVVLAGLTALGILDLYQSYVMYHDDRTPPVTKIHQK